MRLVLVAQVEIVGSECVLVEVQVLGSLAVVRWRLFRPQVIKSEYSRHACLD